MNEDRVPPREGDDAADERTAAWAAMEESYGKVKERLGGLLEETPTAARGLIATGRDYYRRGAAAVASTAGDNSALILLGVGAVGAAAGWLWMRRRRGPKA